jgi:N-acetylmuramoyl-L-alanine amidase
MSLFAKRRKTDAIVIHCSATPAGVFFNARNIDVWHRERGWAGNGYHYVILLDGTVEIGRPEDTVGAHVGGHNSTTIGICYIGGIDANDKRKARDTRTPEQIVAMTVLIEGLLKRYPNAKVTGHRDFPGVAKACPCFDAAKWWNEVQTTWQPVTQKDKLVGYIVGPGDTLFAIATRFNTTVATLATLNALDSTNIQVGQVINLPH